MEIIDKLNINKMTGIRKSFKGEPMEVLNKCHNFISENIGIEGKYLVHIEIDKIITKEE